jgi:hypothetical protein
MWCKSGASHAKVVQKWLGIKQVVVFTHYQTDVVIRVYVYFLWREAVGEVRRKTFAKKSPPEREGISSHFSGLFKAYVIKNSEDCGSSHSIRTTLPPIWKHFLCQKKILDSKLKTDDENDTRIC